MNWAFFTTEWWLLIAMLLYWAIGLVYPKLFTGYLHSAKQGLSKKSTWVRKKTERWLRRVILLSFPLYALLAYWLLGKAMGVAWSLPPLLYWLAGRGYSNSLKRKWEQWQLLGYDGPPELNQQAEKLAGTLPAPTHEPE
ncbi:MAG: hypothetical protein SFY70_01415 [Bacteroidia bacterium]|nr:hypothetical protein [Bacteroidia bacterium]